MYNATNLQFFEISFIWTVKIHFFMVLRSLLGSSPQQRRSSGSQSLTVSWAIGNCPPHQPAFSEEDTAAPDVPLHSHCLWGKMREKHDKTSRVSVVQQVIKAAGGYIHNVNMHNAKISTCLSAALYHSAEPQAQGSRILRTIIPQQNGLHQCPWHWRCCQNMVPLTLME